MRYRVFFENVGNRGACWRFPTDDIDDRTLLLEVRRNAEISSRTLAIDWNADGKSGTLTTRGVLFAGTFTIKETSQ